MLYTGEARLIVVFKFIGRSHRQHFQPRTPSPVLSTGSVHPIVVFLGHPSSPVLCTSDARLTIDIPASGTRHQSGGVAAYQRHARA